jgi:hypothetical protein
MPNQIVPMIKALMATRDRPFKGILSILLVECLKNFVDTPHGFYTKSAWKIWLVR